MPVKMQMHLRVENLMSYINQRGENMEKLCNII